MVAVKVLRTSEKESKMKLKKVSGGKRHADTG